MRTRLRITVLSLSRVTNSCWGKVWQGLLQKIAKKFAWCLPGFPYDKGQTIVQPAGIAELIVFDAFHMFWLCSFHWLIFWGSLSAAPTTTDWEIVQALWKLLWSRIRARAHRAEVKKCRGWKLQTELRIQNSFSGYSLELRTANLNKTKADRQETWSRKAQSTWLIKQPCLPFDTVLFH